MVCITETECAYCAVRTVSLPWNEFQQAILHRTMGRAVSCWPVTREDRFQSQVIPCEIRGGKKWHCDKFFSHYFGFPQYHSANAPYSSSPTLYACQTNKLAKPSNLPKTSVLEETRELWIEQNSPFCSYFEGLLTLTDPRYLFSHIYIIKSFRI